MPDPNSIHAYKDCEAAMEQALNSARGVKVRFDTPQAANTFARRCFSLKKLLRAKNRQIYPDPGHPYHDACVYDAISIKRSKVEPTTVILDKTETRRLCIEEIVD